VTVEPYQNFDEGPAAESIIPITACRLACLPVTVKLLFQAYDGLEVGASDRRRIPSFRSQPDAYGGVKGLRPGREGLRYAIEEMTEPKLLVMNLR